MKKQDEEFRINEYANHFTISKKVVIEKFKTPFHALFGMPEKKECWRLVNADGQTLNVYNWKTKTEFKTKEECLKWIEDYKKYPIYHYLRGIDFSDTNKLLDKLQDKVNEQ